jgi:hypothetical protein
LNWKKCWNRASAEFVGDRRAVRQYPGMMNRVGNRTQVRDARLKRLAESIQALAEKDEVRVRHSREMAASRRVAAGNLHAICADFVNSVNRLLTHNQVELDPRSFSESAFQEDTPNLVQINVRGRILQVLFSATPELVSTEAFRIPYTLEGTVRAFNQELLDKDIIEEQLIFYTLEKEKKMWRFFDARTYRSGPFDQEYLISLMEQLI